MRNPWVLLIKGSQVVSANLLQNSTIVPKKISTLPFKCSYGPRKLDSSFPPIRCWLLMFPNHKCGFVYLSLHSQPCLVLGILDIVQDNATDVIQLLYVLRDCVLTYSFLHTAVQLEKSW